MLEGRSLGAADHLTLGNLNLMARDKKMCTHPYFAKGADVRVLLMEHGNRVSISRGESSPTRKFCAC